MSNQQYWWLAISGNDCYGSPEAMGLDLKVTPTPQKLLGFKSYEDRNAYWYWIEKDWETKPYEIATIQIDAYVRPANPDPKGFDDNTGITWQWTQEETTNV